MGSVGVAAGVEVGRGVGVFGCGGVAQSEKLFEPGVTPLSSPFLALEAASPSGLAMGVASFCGCAVMPLQFNPQCAYTRSTAIAPFGGGVGSETRTVSMPLTGIGTDEPPREESMENVPVGTGTMTLVDAPCSSV